MHFMFRGSNLPKPNFMPHQAKEPWEGGTAKKVSKKGLLSTRGHWTSMLIKCISGQYSNVHWPLMHLDISLLAPLKKQGLTGRKNGLSHKKKQIDKKKHHTHTHKNQNTTVLCWWLWIYIYASFCFLYSVVRYSSRVTVIFMVLVILTSRLQNLLTRLYSCISPTNILMLNHN